MKIQNSVSCDHGTVAKEKKISSSATETERTTEYGIKGLEFKLVQQI